MSFLTHTHVPKCRPNLRVPDRRREDAALFSVTRASAHLLLSLSPGMHAVNREVPGPPILCEPQHSVQQLRALGLDIRRSSTTAGPRRLVQLPPGRSLLFWLLLHSNAPAPLACARPLPPAQLVPASVADQLLELRSFIPVPGRPQIPILCKHIWASSAHMTGTSAAPKERTQGPYCNQS